MVFFSDNVVPTDQDPNYSCVPNRVYRSTIGGTARSVVRTLGEESRLCFPSYRRDMQGYACAGIVAFRPDPNVPPDRGRLSGGGFQPRFGTHILS